MEDRSARLLIEPGWEPVKPHDVYAWFVAMRASRYSLKLFTYSSQHAELHAFDSPGGDDDQLTQQAGVIFRIYESHWVAEHPNLQEFEIELLDVFDFELNEFFNDEKYVSYVRGIAAQLLIGNSLTGPEVVEMVDRLWELLGVSVEFARSAVSCERYRPPVPNPHA